MNQVKGKVFSPLSIGEVEPLQHGENPPLHWDGAKTHTDGEIKSLSYKWGRLASQSLESEIEQGKTKVGRGWSLVEHI